MASLKEIASALGLSVATISYVYNGKWREQGIREATAERVKEALRAYRPNVIGRQLRSGKTQTIGIVLADLTRSYSLKMLAAIEKELAAAQYLAILCNADLGVWEVSHLQTLLSRRVDGIIFAPQAIDSESDILLELEQKQTPFIQVDNHIESLEADFVVTDNRWGACQAVRRLLRNGRRNIAYLGSCKPLASLQDRFVGYVDALRERGLEPANGRVQRVSDASGAIVAALEKILEIDKPDAIFVESFLYFREGIHWLRAHGIRIPQDVELAGFDAPDFGPFPSAVIHVEQDAQRMGEMAAHRLLERIRHQGCVAGEPLREFIRPILRF